MSRFVSRKHPKWLVAMVSSSPWGEVFLFPSSTTPALLIWNKSQPTTSDHINMKYIRGPHGKPYGDPTLVTHRDLQKVYTLN